MHIYHVYAVLPIRRVVPAPMTYNVALQHLFAPLRLTACFPVSASVT